MPKNDKPSHLKIDLFAPGMSIIHRAGIGGLAATLNRLAQLNDRGDFDVQELPGGPWKGNKPPWAISKAAIDLDFGNASSAAQFLEKLFAFAFQLRDGLMFLPGQYGEQPPNLQVRAYLQQGMTLSFLQHGRVRKLAKKETVYSYQPDGHTGPTIQLAYKECSDYKHRNGWKDLVDGKGMLRTTPVEVVGPMNPGAVVRHNAFAGQTKIEELPGHILSLYFALVGCLTLSVNRATGVLVIPEVDDLLEFAEERPWITPQSPRECRITSASDAALQAQVRLRANRTAQSHGLPGCLAVTFRPTPWASQQKSRVHTIHVPSDDDVQLDQFEIALAELPPRVASRTVKETKGRGKNRKVTERTESFWVDSAVRPLVADNLAREQPWYLGFVDLMTKVDPATKKPIREKVKFEKRGLNSMIEKVRWEDKGESTVVRAIHEAIRRRYGQIASENKGNPVTMKNRMGNEYDRWRLAFSGAKTHDQFRRSFCDLLSRAGVNPVLQSGWESLLPMLDSSRWQQARDLALLGLVSYAGKGANEPDEANHGSEIEVDAS